MPQTYGEVIPGAITAVPTQLLEKMCAIPTAKAGAPPVAVVKRLLANGLCKGMHVCGVLT